MKGFKGDIFTTAIENTNFRKVLYTGENSQLVLMSLLPNEEIGLETHDKNDQFFCVAKGFGGCTIDGNVYNLREGDAVLVPQGALHNVINLSPTEALKLFTIYSPPHHADGIVRVTKSDAAANEQEFDGVTSESRSG